MLEVGRAGRYVAEDDVFCIPDHKGRCGIDPHIGQGNIPGSLNYNTLFCSNVDLFERDIGDRHFLQPDDFDGAVDLTAGKVGDMDIPEDGRPLRNRFRIHFAVLQVQNDRLPLNVLHHDVADPDLLHNTSPATGGFEPYPTVGTIKDAVGDHHLAHITTHFAADDHTAVAGQHGAVGDGDVLAGHSQLAGLCIATRLEGDTVVPHRDMAVRDVHIFTGGGVDPIGIGRNGIFYGYTSDGDVLTKLGVDGPEGGVDNLDTLNADIVTADGLKKWGTEKTSLQGSMKVTIGKIIQGIHIVLPVPHWLVSVEIPHSVLAEILDDTVELIPPLLPLSVNGSSSLNGDVLLIHRIDEWGKALHQHTLISHLHKREIIFKTIGEEQRGSCFQLQSDVALHPDGSGEVSPRGEVDLSATLFS